MRSLNRKYSRDAYWWWLYHIKNSGSPVDVRGRSTLEVLNAITEIEEPWHHCILLPSRRWNPWLALSEALWILAGRSDVAALTPYNSHILDYSDDSINLYGAYGRRIFDQIDPLIERLKHDPSDRRAVISIWQVQDLSVNSKDPPCNNLVYFKLRDNKLHMTVICRSNDLHFGLFAVNLPTFSILQSYIAARLGVDMGTQTHLSNSLHIYTDDKRAVEITDRMLYEEDPEIEYPEHELVFTESDFRTPTTHEQMAWMCSSVLDNKAIPKEWPPFLIFASKFLRAYRERNLSIIDAPTKQDNYYGKVQDRYQDWVLSAKVFAEQVWRHD